MSQRTFEPVLLTGGSGFIGSHVRQLLSARGTPVRVLARRPAAMDGDETVRGDLTDAVSLRGICDGVTTVVHSASVIGGSEDECRAVNESGTAALLAEARRAGVSRFVYVSTAAVYGAGVHRGIGEDSLAPAPESPTSRSRLAAEHLVRAEGGTVLRPMFVYGDGDRWVVPAAARLVRWLGARPEGGRARLSLISVDALAEAVCAVAGRPTNDLNGAVLHAAHPEPVALAEILDALAEHSLAPATAGDIGYEQALAVSGEEAARLLSLVSFDHYYDSSRLWRAVGTIHGAGFRETFPRYVRWYRQSGLPGPAAPASRQPGA